MYLYVRRQTSVESFCRGRLAERLNDVFCTHTIHLYYNALNEKKIYTYILRTYKGVIINIILQYYYTTVCHDDDSATHLNDILNYYRYMIN